MTSVARRGTPRALITNILPVFAAFVKCFCQIKHENCVFAPLCGRTGALGRGTGGRARALRRENERQGEGTQAGKRAAGRRRSGGGGERAAARRAQKAPAAPPYPSLLSPEAPRGIKKVSAQGDVFRYRNQVKINRTRPERRLLRALGLILIAIPLGVLLLRLSPQSIAKCALSGCEAIESG